MVGRAIKGWDSDLTVAIIGSGGMSHFVIDEDLDNLFMKALESRNADVLTNLDELNKIIMLRDLESLTVKHENGLTETIAFPEDIGSELFLNGAFPAFGLRTKSSFIESVDGGSLAEEAGLKSKDKIIEIDGEKLEYFDQIQSALYKKKSKKVTLSILRKGENDALDTLVLESKVNLNGLLGFVVGISEFADSSAVETISYSFGNIF